jgi:hypothetical protein
VRRRSGLVVPRISGRDGRRSSHPPAGSPATRHDGRAVGERLAILKRGQILGFRALILVLATIVALAAIGQPWVAGVVATTGLPAIVAIFVTGRYQPSAVHTPEVASRQPVRRPRPELQEAPLPPPSPAIE